MGHSHSRGSFFALIIVIILISALLAGYGISERAQQSALAGGAVTQYGTGGLGSFNFLFGNFSGMTLIENYTTPDGSTSSCVISYYVLAMAQINATRTYEVNISGIMTSNGETDKESLLVWIGASTGHVIQTYDNDDGYLDGPRAQEENPTLSMFTTLPFLSMLNSSAVEQVQGPPKPVSIGQANMFVTSYRGVSSFTDLKDWIVDVGINPVTGTKLVVFCSYLVPSSGWEFSFQIMSLEYNQMSQR